MLIYKQTSSNMTRITMNDFNHDLYIKEKKTEFTELQNKAAQLKRRPGFKVIKLCPVCVFTAVKQIPYTGGIYPEMYYCPKCNWQGVIPLEVDIEDLALLWDRWLEAELAEQSDPHGQASPGDFDLQEQESDDDLEIHEDTEIP